MRASESTANLCAAVVECMRQIGYIRKDWRNDAQRFNFLSDEAVTLEVQRAMVAHGLFCAPVKSESRIERTETANASGKAGVRTVTVTLITWRITHTSGEWMLLESEGEGVDSGDKSLSKSRTMARKYLWRELFAIPTGDQDPDAVNGYEPPAQTQRNAPSEPPAPEGPRLLNAGTVANIMRRLEGCADSALFASSRASIEAKLSQSTDAVIQPLRAAVESCSAGQIDGAALVARVSEILS